MVGGGRASGVKMGEDRGGLLIGTGRVALSRMIGGVSASCYLPLHSESPEEDLFWYWLTLEKGP